MRFGSEHAAGQIRTVSDAERLARRRLPATLYRGIGGGTGQELTRRWNHEAFESVAFLPRPAVQHGAYELETMVLGHRISLPVMLAPTGSLRMFHVDGEPAAARAAGSAGTIIIVSCFTGYPIEDVVASATGPVFFGMYMAGGRENAEAMIGRAKRAGCAALIVTIDIASTHPKERRGRERGFRPVKLDWKQKARFLPDLLPRPVWALDFVRDGMHLECPMWIRDDGRPAMFGDMMQTIYERWPTWEDLAWIRKSWDGPLVLKGILRPEDARRAADEGIDAIVVSNHGARNVDGTPASLPSLPEVVDAVDGRMQIYLDSGIRRATDVVKAVALGADAVLIGAANVYALAAAGEPGVRQMLEVFRTGIDHTLRSLGCPSVSALDPSYVVTPPTWREARIPDRGRDIQGAGVGRERDKLRETGVGGNG